MGQPALLFGLAARPGSPPGKACGAKFDLLGADAGGVDEGLDVNVHGFGPGPISLHLTPNSVQGALPNLEKRGRERGRPRQQRKWSEIGVPDCFISSPTYTYMNCTCSPTPTLRQALG